MRIPNAQHAVVDIRKLVDYCLSPGHPRGKHKARVFKAACGLTAEHAEDLREQLLAAADQGEAILNSSIGQGEHYVVEREVSGPTGTALVCTSWIIRQDEDFPRLVSAYVIEEPRDE